MPRLAVALILTLLPVLGQPAVVVLEQSPIDFSSKGLISGVLPPDVAFTPGPGGPAPVPIPDSSIGDSTVVKGGTRTTSTKIRVDRLLPVGEPTTVAIDLNAFLDPAESAVARTFLADPAAATPLGVDFEFAVAASSNVRLQFDASDLQLDAFDIGFELAIPESVLIPGSALEVIGLEIRGLAFAAVPEPAPPLLVVLGLMLVARRRRRAWPGYCARCPRSRFALESLADFASSQIRRVLHSVTHVITWPRRIQPPARSSRDLLQYRGYRGLPRRHE